MPTEIIKVDQAHPDPSIIEHAASLLRAGELVVFPTETVYGLGADALQTAGLESIFAAKGRPFSDPLIVHIADETSLDQLTAFIPEQARRLASVFWPGPLTLILPRGQRIPHLVTAGLETVAIRMPRHPVALALIRALGSPIAAPSANRFMHVSPTTAQHAYTDLAGRVPLILDSGPCEVGVESTVLNLCTEPPTILRPGGVILEALRTVLPEVQPPRQRIERRMSQGAREGRPYNESSEPANEPGHAINESSELANEPGYVISEGAREGRPYNETDARTSPGQMLTHYAPAIPLLLYDGPVEAMRTAMLAELKRRQEQGEYVGVLVADEDRAAFQHSGALIQTLGNADDPVQIATALFAGLRALEDAHVQVILCRNFDDHGLGLAIRDRLLKAAGGKIIKV